MAKKQAGAGGEAGAVRGNHETSTMDEKGRKCLRMSSRVPSHSEQLRSTLRSDYWQIGTDAQNLMVKAWRNGSLQETEVLPLSEGGRVGQGCEERVSPPLGIGVDGFHLKVPMDLTEGELCSSDRGTVGEGGAVWGVDQCRPPRCSVPRPRV